jgi:integrase
MTLGSSSSGNSCARERQRSGSVKWRGQDVSLFERSWDRSLTGSLPTQSLPVAVRGAHFSPSPRGAQLRRSNFGRAWGKALAAAGLSDIHFHDLRHTGNALAGEEGASLRELMERMGHSSTRAAVIYQHRTMHRDKIIADAMGKRAMAELKRSGTQRARGQEERSR